MDYKEVVANLIKTIRTYNQKQESFKQIFSNEPVMSKALEVFDDEVYELIDYILELIGIPSEEAPTDYDGENWTRNVCSKLITMAAANEKCEESAVELIVDWKNLREHTAKVESHTWFHYTELLDEHRNGFRKWHEEQRMKEQAKNKTA